MNDKGKTKEQLIQELTEMRRIVSVLEKLVDEHKKVEDDLRKNNAILQDFMDNANDLIQSITQDGRFLYVNRAWLETMGYSEDEISNLNIFNIIHPDCIPHCMTIFQDIMAGGIVSNIETIFVAKDGTSIMLEGSINTKFENGKPISIRGIFRNITERKKLEDALKIAATIDKLTDIYNRHKFEDILKQEIERTKRYKSPLSLVMFDIDHFKNINDTYGHQVGDYVLKTMANIVRNNIRITDFFGRWGGEEFMILMPETIIKNAGELAEKIRNIIENYIFEDVKSVTISCGVTQFIKDDTFDSFIKRVDDALYHAKKRGRNRIEIWG